MHRIVECYTQFFIIASKNELLIEGINELTGTLESAIEDTKELRNVLNDTMEHVNILGAGISK